MIQFRVYGRPAPQGSKRHLGGGVMVESSKAVKPWREAVKYAALQARADAGHPAPMDGPVALFVIFLLPRPKRLKGNAREWCDRTPDASKLVRATEDAMTDAGVWADDARVVGLSAMKVYAAPDESPGAIVRVGGVAATAAMMTQG